MGMRLDFEQVSECAHDQAVHDQSGCEGGEFRRDGVHVCLRVSWRLSILTAITQQGPCQLQKPGKKGIWKVIFAGWSDAGDRGQCPRTRRTDAVSRDPFALSQVRPVVVSLPLLAPDNARVGR